MEVKMAKKQRKHERTAVQVEETKNGLNSLKDMLNADALGKLKLLEKEMKADNERKNQELAEQKRREQEERERNKSFGELLADYEKKGGGKFS